MANKKLLICAALATGLLLTACVKKEEPKNEDQAEPASEVQSTQQEPEPEKIQEFESLDSVDNQEAPAPVIETSREETTNTTTEIRRETRPAQSANEGTSSSEQNKPVQTEQKPAKTEQPKTESVKTPKSSAPAQSEDDAVAAAIAAATPALNN